MKTRMLPDTDVLIDFFRGHEKAIHFISAHAGDIILSVIVIAELYAGIKDRTEQAVLDKFTNAFPVIPVSSVVAKCGGHYRKQYGKSHGLGLADALIAATCDTQQAQLQTLNVRHYPMFEGLVPPYRKE